MSRLFKKMKIKMWKKKKVDPQLTDLQRHTESGLPLAASSVARQYLVHFFACRGARVEA